MLRAHCWLYPPKEPESGEGRDSTRLIGFTEGLPRGFEGLVVFLLPVLEGREYGQGGEQCSGQLPTVDAVSITPSALQPQCHLRLQQ